MVGLSDDYLSDLSECCARPRAIREALGNPKGGAITNCIRYLVPQPKTIELRKKYLPPFLSFIPPYLFFPIFYGLNEIKVHFREPLGPKGVLTVLT